MNKLQLLLILLITSTIPAHITLSMKTKKKDGFNTCVPETPIEALDQLEEFFLADMWYAQGAEWKTREDMVKYLQGHFEICKEQIKSIPKTIQRKIK